ncbi:MAG TPA: HDIG domain-containing protein [Syntrophales bacterium]|nr:HDIG domain-containing protein [Syntrophales bacterium]
MNRNNVLLKPRNHAGGPINIPDFLKRVSFQRWLILIVFSLSLSLVLFSDRVVSVPDFFAGAIAGKDLRADRDFPVIDRSATNQKKAEALRTVEPVFDRDEDIASLLTVRISAAFDGARKSLQQEKKAASPHTNGERESLRSIKQDFELTSGIVLTDREFAVLEKRGFSEEIMGGISRLLNDVFKNHLISRSDFERVESTKGIVIRNIGTGEEEIFRNTYPVIMVEDILPLLKKRAEAILRQEEPTIRAVIVSIVQKAVKPNLVFNREATESRRQLVMKNLKPVYIMVHKNELIVREGDRISPQQMDTIEAYYQARSGSAVMRLSLFLGIFFTVAVFTIVLYCLSKGFLKNLENSNGDLLFLGCIALLQVLVVRIGILVSEAVNHAFPAIPLDACYYALPFAMGPMIAVVFLNRNIALIFSVFLSFLITFQFDNKMPMFLFSFLGSAVSVYNMDYVNQRSATYRSGLFAGLVNVSVILCITLLSGTPTFPDTFIKLLGGLIGGILSGVIVAGITPLLESAFHYTTNIKLLELSNLNQPILQRMIVEAPGTYHHSMIVASMVEAAAEAINANSLLAKVSAYYHDIGKLTKPLYFIENQIGCKNKHDYLSPKMSSLVIISHVKDGCDLARRYKLGKAITDVIRQHHGTSVVSYFYEKAQKDKDPTIRSIPESEFRYPGPKPQTKEAGLVLLGDVVEASSRSLTEPTPSRIKSLVQTRIRQVLNDGQLDDCELTLRDLNKIAEVFERTLNAIFHHRIDYPNQGVKETDGRRASNGVYDFKPPEKAKGRH